MGSPLPRIARGLFACLVLAGAVPAGALGAGLPKKGESVSDTGVLVAVKPGALLVETKKYGKVVVNIPTNGRQVVTLKGNLTLDQLKPGMFARTFGTVKGSQIEGEIGELVLFSPADGYQMGVFTSSPDQPATINGRVEKISEQTLTLNAGKKLTATLGAKVVIRVDTNDYSLAGAGNGVTLTGRVAGEGTITPKSVVIAVGDAPDAKKPDAKKKK